MSIEEKRSKKAELRRVEDDLRASRAESADLAALSQSLTNRVE